MMKNLLCICLFSFCFICQSYGQAYTGKVVDSKTRKALDAVNVVLLDDGQAPLAYAYSTPQGAFAIAVPVGKKAIQMSLSIVGYSRKIILLSQYTIGQTVMMDEKVLQIKEVKITSHRLSQSHDTLTYSVSGFRQKQDRTIADVIAKMPGLEVKPNGAIAYQGKTINKFYIEGMDLLGSKYAQASDNLSADKVKDVQVLENHQPVKALRNINFCDQAALNIVLKDDAKNTWTGVMDAGVGTTLQGKGQLLRDVRVMGMMFGARLQNISMYKCNNTGKDIQREVQDLAHPTRSMSDENGVFDLLSLSAADIDKERYRFNDTHLFAVNHLFGMGKERNLRFQCNVLVDNSRQSQYKETRYTDLNDAATITEEASIHNRRSEWKGELQYQLNGNKAYLNNIVRGYADFNKGDGNSILNGTSVRQWVQPRQRSLSDDFEWLHTLDNGRSLSISAQVAYNYLPGILLLANGNEEQLGIHSFRADAYTYFRHRLAGMYVTYKTGLKGKSQKYNIQYNPISAEEKYSEWQYYLTPSVSFIRSGLKFSASLPLSVSARKYNRKTKHSCVADPSVNLQYELTGKISIAAAYSSSHYYLDLGSICATPFYTDYIVETRGTGTIEESASRMLLASVEYSDPLKGLFSNVSFRNHLLSHTPLYESTLSGNVYRHQASGQYSHTSTYVLQGRAGKAWGWGKMSVAVNGSLSWNNYNLLLRSKLTPYQMHTGTVGIVLSFRPVPLLSFEENSSFDFNKQVNKTDPSLSTPMLHSFRHNLKTFILPGRWQIEWDNECYHSNDKSVSFNFFSNLSVSYRTKALEVSIGMNNLFGNRQYERRNVTAYQQVYTFNLLRPHEALCKVSFNL